MSPTSTSGSQRPRDVRLATPSEWFDLDLDPRTRRRSHQRLVTRRIGAGPDGAGLRRQVVDELEAAADRAAAAGARFASVYSQIHDRLPVAATLLGVVRGRLAEQTPALEPDLEAAADALRRDAPSGSCEVVNLPVGPALRRRHRVAVDRSGRAKLTDNVTYIVPMPDPGGTLMLEFSTPTLPVADAMADLFDAIAASLRWQY